MPVEDLPPKPENFPLCVYRGDILSEDVQFLNGDNSPMDLQGYSAAAEVRDRSGAAIVVTLTTAIDLTTATVTMSLTIAQTKALDQATHRYDLELTNGTITKTPVAGTFEIRDDITEL
jgi:hypothetical protein